MRIFPNNRQVNRVVQDSKNIQVKRELKESAIPLCWDATNKFAQFCYCVERLVKPENVVETGVGRGISTTFILQALNENEKGCLYSVELPPLIKGAINNVGIFVPQKLKAKWTLIFGPGDQEMLKLRKKLNMIDLFIHDSQHSYSNQYREYNLTIPWLKGGGLLVSDDVENDALFDINEKLEGELMIIRQQKPGFIGIIIK